MAVLDVFLPFQNEWAVFWASALFVAFVVLSGLFSLVGPFKAKPMLAAHHLVMVFPFAWLSYQGAVHWNSSSKLVPDDASSRLFFQVESAACFAPTMLGLQVFNLSTTLLLYSAGDKKMMENQALFISFGFINVFLCGIQQFWGFKIVTAAIKMAKGDKSGRDKEV
ncbi:hypothetical protein T492DRAFT_1072010 [Pavlovales sp. CCMP2436]|nr:hypothetical protein T492DRAFT_1072010 [Pavlovales sp. CCMP2436]